MRDEGLSVVGEGGDKGLEKVTLLLGRRPGWRRCPSSSRVYHEAQKWCIHFVHTKIPHREGNYMGLLGLLVPKTRWFQTMGIYSHSSGG